MGIGQVYTTAHFTPFRGIFKNPFVEYQRFIKSKKMKKVELASESAKSG